MQYENFSTEAISELERQRTGNYGEYVFSDEYDNQCDICKNHSYDIYNINSHYICRECICERFRDSVVNADISASIIDISAILYDIVTDFSDDEIISYVDNIYERI